MIRALTEVIRIQVISVAVLAAFGWTLCAPMEAFAKGTTPASTAPVHKASKAPVARRSVTVTNGWREISGWEHGIVRKQSNLRRWCWLPMREMRKGAMNVGSVPRGQRGKSKPRYIKPNHVATRLPDRQREPRRVVQTLMPSRYIKPNHIPTIVTEPRTNTYIKQAAPETKAAVRTTATSIQLGDKDTRIQWKGNNQSLAVDFQKPVKPPAVDRTPNMSTQSTDAFASPDPYAHNVYGLARGVGHPQLPANSGTSLKGRLLPRSKKHK